MGMEFEDAGFLGGAVGPFEEDVALGVVSEDALGAEGTSLDVSGKVAEGGFSAADRLELDVPLGSGIEGAVLLCGEFGEDLGVLGFEGALDEAAEASGERSVVNEEVFGVLGPVEGFVFWVQGDGWKDDVDVRVVLGLASPSV